MRRLTALDRKIDILRTKQQCLENKARNARVNRAKKMFLNAKWLLDENLELHVTDINLVKALCALEEEIGDDFGFGNKEPWSLLHSFYFHTDLEDENDQKITGEMSCELDDGLMGRMGTLASLLVVRPILEKLVAHLKNLKMDLPTISWRIAEAQVELTELLALIREHNRYRKKEK